MQLINYRLGNISVAIRAELPQKLGNDVRNTGNHDIDLGYGFVKIAFLRVLEAADGALLVYKIGDDSLEHEPEGLLPVAFLKTKTPLKRDKNYAEVKRPCARLN